MLRRAVVWSASARGHLRPRALFIAQVLNSTDVAAAGVRPFLASAPLTSASPTTTDAAAAATAATTAGAGATAASGAPYLAVGGLGATRLEDVLIALAPAHGRGPITLAHSLLPLAVPEYGDIMWMRGPVCVPAALAAAQPAAQRAFHAGCRLASRM